MGQAHERIVLFGLTLPLFLAACPREAVEEPAKQDEQHLIRLGGQARELAQLETIKVGPVKIKPQLTFQGDLKLPAEKLAKIVTRVSGVLRSITKKEGDRVERGELIGVIESRELGEAALKYLEAAHKVEFAERAFQREKQLWDKKITAEEAFQSKQHDLEEARLALKTAQQRLNVLGIAEGQIGRLTRRAAAQLSRYSLIAPFTGTVIKRQVTLGQAVSENTELLEIADLSTLDVEFRVPAQQLAHLAVGQPVQVTTKLDLQGQGTIYLISPVVDQATRTAMVRAQIANAEGRWRPGICASVELGSAELQVELAVPKAAIHELGEQRVVFVQHGRAAFAAAPVTTGLDDGTWVEIKRGLQSGAIVVTKNSLVLKAAWEQQTGE